MKLKTLKAQFEKRTEGGLEYKILDYKAGALFPIRAVMKGEDGEWRVLSYTDKGLYIAEQPVNKWNLVIKAGIEQSQVEPGVYFEHVGEGKYVARKP